MRFKNTLSFAFLALILGGLLYGFINLQAISDWLRLRNYDPPERIVAIASKTTMNGDTKRLFYINHPQLGDKVTFNDHCRTTGQEQSIVLGCFIEGKGIFLLDVTDERLDGVIEVTAAHEVLHAAYERLSSSKRQEVDRMTEEFFNNLKDERIKKTIENYRKKDPNIVPNELHSILGTEVHSLSPELEAYYVTYFTDRSKIVDLSAQYEQTFISLRQQVDDYDVQLSQLKSEIDNNQKKITALNAELKTDRARLDALLAADQTQEYNASVPDYNKKVADYNVLVNSTRQLISDYNDLVKERNALATEEQELVEALDSSQLTTEEKE